jgi:hypothetical protein
MQNFDIPQVTPPAETPSKRKKPFSMMEAKPAPREVPVEKAKTKRPSLRLVKPETGIDVQEAKQVKSLRRSVAEAKTPVSEVDTLKAQIKSLKGRLTLKLGHPLQGKTAEEIGASVSFGDRARSWLDKIMGKQKEATGIDELLNELKLKEHTLSVKMEAEVSVVEPAPLPKKPRTVRDIKTRIAELEAKQAAEADKALENLHVEVVEEKPVAKKVNIGERIDKAKAKSTTLGAEDIIPEIKTSPMAESVRLPEAEVEIPVTIEEEEPAIDRMTAKPDYDQDLQEILHLQPETALYKNRNNREIKSRLLKLLRDQQSNESEANALEKSIKALKAKGQEEKALITEKELEKLGNEWQATFNNEMNELEGIARLEATEGVIEIEPEPSLRTVEKKAKREKFRKELAEETTKEKVKVTEGLEKKFWENATQRLNDRVEAIAKVNFDYGFLVRQKKNPEILKMILDLTRQDVNKRISEDARLEEESILKEEFQDRLERARKAKNNEAEIAIQKEFDAALDDFRKKTIDLSYQWAIEYEEKLDKIVARAKEIEEEASLPEAEIIEEKKPSEVAPPPPTARERKRRIELQKALSGRADIESLEELEPIEESVSKKAPPPPSAEERKRRLDQKKEEIKFEESLSDQGKKIYEAATKHLEEEEAKVKEGWLGQILRDHPLIAKYTKNPALAQKLEDLKFNLQAFDARRDGIIENKGSRKERMQELKNIAFERTETVNRAIEDLEATVKALENPQEKKVPTILAKEKADAYQGLRQDLRARIKDEKQIEEYIEFASKRDKYLRKNDELLAGYAQDNIDRMNKEWNKQGLIGDNEDPSVALTGKSGIGRMNVIGSDLATRRGQRGKYEGDTPSGVREKTRSKLEKTAKLETKELQPFNTAWAIEKLGTGAAKRWDLIAPTIIEGKLGPAIVDEIQKIVNQVESLEESEKENFSDEYKALSSMMETIRQTERFNQSPESAAYIFLRAMSPKDSSDFLAQDLVEAGLAKLDQMIAQKEQEIARKKGEKQKEEEKGFSIARAKPAPRGTTKPPTLKKSEPVVPKTKKARTIRAPGKSEAA